MLNSFIKVGNSDFCVGKMNNQPIIVIYHLDPPKHEPAGKVCGWNIYGKEAIEALKKTCEKALE